MPPPRRPLSAHPLRRTALASLLPFGAAAVVLASSSAPVACAPKACSLVGCGDVDAVLKAHVPLAPGALLGAKTVVCWNLVCASLASGSDGGLDGGVGLDPLGNLRGTVTLAPEGTGSLLDVQLTFFTRALDGTFMYTRQANGDRYRVTVTDANGKVLFDVEKDAVYDTYYPNGPDCDPDPCMTVTLDLTR